MVCVINEIVNKFKTLHRLISNIDLYCICVQPPIHTPIRTSIVRFLPGDGLPIMMSSRCIALKC